MTDDKKQIKLLRRVIVALVEGGAIWTYLPPEMVKAVRIALLEEGKP